MKKAMVLAVALTAVTLIAGCSSLARKVYDKDKNLLIEETFSGDAIGMISYDLKDKIVFDYLSGTFIAFKISPPSTDDPMGAIKATYSAGQTGHLSIPKDCKFTEDDGKAMAGMITATTGKDVALNKDGINTTGK